VLNECGGRAVIECTRSRSRVLEKSERGLDDGLQRNAPVVRSLGNRRDEAYNPSLDPGSALGLIFSVRALLIGQLGIRCARFVELLEESKRQFVRRPAPSCLRTGDGPGRLPCGKPLVVFLDAHVTRLKKVAEMGGREVRLDPVAEAEERASWTRGGGRDAGPERHRPLVPERLLPDEGDVCVRAAGDLDLVQRRAGLEDSSEDLLDFRFAAARVEQTDAILATSGRHQKRQRMALRVRLHPFDLCLLHSPRA